MQIVANIDGIDSTTILKYSSLQNEKLDNMILVTPPALRYTLVEQMCWGINHRGEYEG